MLRTKLAGGCPKKILYRLPSEHLFGAMEMNEVSPADGLISYYFFASCQSASESRDKVYGLYAILQRCGVKLLLPDYKKSISMSFQDTAQALI